MQTYETIFVTSPVLTEDEEKATVDAFTQLVTDGGGTFAANDRMGRRRLAYPIEKHQDGVYTRFLYDSESAVPKELERRMRISDKVLRVLTVRMEPRWAVFSKEQAVRDAQARVEAAEREKEERERQEQEAIEAAAAAAAAPPADEDGAPAAEGEAKPAAEGEAKPAVKVEAKPAAESEAKPAVKVEAKPATEAPVADKPPTGSSEKS